MNILFVRPTPPPETIGLQHIMVVEPLEFEVLAAVAGEDDYCLVADMILEKEPLDEIILRFKPDLFCVTGYITHMNVLKEYCRAAKEILPGVRTVVGGVHIERFPEDVDDPSVDYRVVRNATRAFPGLLNHLKKGAPLPEEILLPGESVHDRILPPFDFYFPTPVRSLTQKYRHRYFYVYHNKVALVKTSFGCPYTCKFCYCRTITDDHYFARPMDDVIAELKGIREKEIYIVDDDFLLSPARMKEFIRRIREEGIKKRYLVYGRADFIAAHPDLIKELHDVGLRTVIVGIESFNDDELTSFEKRTSREINELALRTLKQYCVNCYAAVIVSPHWSEEDFRKAGDKLVELGIQFVNLQPLTPLKGTGVDYPEEELAVPRSDYPRWDLAHVIIRPTKMSVSQYYLQILKLYLRVTFQPRHLLYRTFRYSPAMQWKLAKGLYRVHQQYRERIEKAKTEYAENTFHTAHPV